MTQEAFEKYLIDAHELANQKLLLAGNVRGHAATEALAEARTIRRIIDEYGKDFGKKLKTVHIDEVEAKIKAAEQPKKRLKR